jgi:hypothetical protein
MPGPASLAVRIKRKSTTARLLISAELTRLYEDSMDLEGWRSKGFFTVLDEEDPRQGLIYRMLALKQEHPLPAKARCRRTSI